MDEHFIPNLLVSDEGGNVFDVPELRMTGMSGTRPVLPETDELIDLPYGSDVFMLPDRIAVGFDPREEAFVLLPEYQGKRVFPVAAFMAPAYMQFLLPAYREPELPEYDARSQARTRSGPAPPAFSGRYAPLPMYGYTAVGWRENGAVVPAVRIDDDIRQDLACVDLDAISEKAPEVKKHYPGNRLVAHLVDNCALCYGCPAARNFVLGRWECPVPASRVCNAGCIGCISYQQKDSGMRVAQERIAFVPTADEIVEFTVPHLESADKAVISFGQGCEGEPLMVADLLIEAVAKIRERTSKGIINLNTNGSKPDKIPALA